MNIPQKRIAKGSKNVKGAYNLIGYIPSTADIYLNVFHWIFLMQHTDWLTLLPTLNTIDNVLQDLAVKTLFIDSPRILSKSTIYQSHSLA